MKILILRFSSIGDIVLTTPVIRCLKLQLGAEIHYVTKRQYESVLKENPYIDCLHLYGKSYKQLFHKLRSEKFDYLIDLHNNQRSLLFKLALGVPHKTVDKINVQKWLKVHLKIDRLPALHMVDRYMATTQKLNIQNDNAGLDYFISESDKVNIAEYFPTFQPNHYIAFSIGGSFFTRRMPIEKIISICKDISLKLNMPIVLLGGPDEKNTGEQIVQELEKLKEQQLPLNNTSNNFNITNACGKLRLNQSASVVKQSAWVITHDTGLMHIATAYGKNLVAIWGNTIPEFGMYPYPKNSNQKRFNIEVKGLDCRPCSKIGAHKCPKGHFRCLKEIDEAEVLACLNQ